MAPPRSTRQRSAPRDAISRGWRCGRCWSPLRSERWLGASIVVMARGARLGQLRVGRPGPLDRAGHGDTAVRRRAGRLRSGTLSGHNLRRSRRSCAAKMARTLVLPSSGRRDTARDEKGLVQPLLRRPQPSRLGHVSGWLRHSTTLATLSTQYPFKPLPYSILELLHHPAFYCRWRTL